MAKAELCTRLLLGKHSWLLQCSAVEGPTVGPCLYFRVTSYRVHSDTTAAAAALHQTSSAPYLGQGPRPDDSNNKLHLLYSAVRRERNLLPAPHG